MDKKLGTFHKIFIRDYFKNEANDFTPWLAKQKNINILADTLNLDLEVIEVEARVGKFSADIIAKDSYSNKNIVIENQLTRSNHDHLGKILTYSAGYDAGIMIWIAETIQDEHKEAISYLNKISSDEYSFFGIEIELWRIDDSAPAPRFNVIVAPNEWSKTINSNRYKSGLPQTTDTQKLQKEFWEGFVNYLDENNSKLKYGKPGYRTYFTFRFPYKNIYIGCNINATKSHIFLSLYMADGFSTFELLENHKSEIESKLGGKLEWRVKPNRKNSDIIMIRPDSDYNNKNNWNIYYEWFFINIENYYKTFSETLNKLEIN